MNSAQSFLDKVSDVYYPGAKYPISNFKRYNSFGLCKIAEKLSLPITTSHLRTKNYIIIVSTDSVFKCIINYLCKEQIFQLSESNTNYDHTQSCSLFVVLSKNSTISQKLSNLPCKLIYSNSPLINLVDIIYLPINIIDYDNDAIFDMTLNSAHVFVYCSILHKQLVINYLNSITKYKIAVGVYSPSGENEEIAEEFREIGIFDRVKFVKTLILPSEVELVEHLLDSEKNEAFREFYNELFHVEANKTPDNMQEFNMEIDRIMKNKCSYCLNKLESDFKTITNPHSNREFRRKIIICGIICLFILVSILSRGLRDSNLAISRFLITVLNSLAFRILYYLLLLYLLVICVKFTDREFFRQKEESITKYLNEVRNVIKTLKKSSLVIN